MNNQKWSNAESSEKCWQSNEIKIQLQSWENNFKMSDHNYRDQKIATWQDVRKRTDSAV